mgnify:CR=1 FL=1
MEMNLIRVTMTFTNFKIAWRNIRKKKIQNLINLIGLTLGITFLLLVGAYIWDVHQVNSKIKNIDQQFLLQSKYKKEGFGINLTTIGALPKALYEEYPNLVADYYRIDGLTGIVANGATIHEEGMALGDPSLLTMFGFEILAGNPNTALNNPFSVVITDRAALKYFGNTHVLGKTLQIKNFRGEKHDFEITAKPITVTADASQTKVYGTADPVFTYAVSPSLVGNDAFSGTLERISGENVGNYAIGQGTLTAGGNYAITYAGKDFEITAKTIEVTADSKTKVYGETDSALTYSFTPSLESGDSFTGELSRAMGENIGNYAISQGTLSAGSNYSIDYVSKDYTITAKPITVTVDASQKKIYGSAEPILTSTVSPSLVGSDAFTGALSRIIGENVGSYAIEQGDLSAGSNYTITFESKDFEITPKGISVSANASQSKYYGDADPIFTYTASEALISGNDFSGSLSRANGENAGTYDYTIGSLSAGSNYVLTLVASDAFAIAAKPITVTADASQTKVYGTADPVFTYAVSPSLVGNDAFSGTLERLTGENVGTYAISQGTLTAGSNYIITYTGNDFEITKADQVITWNQTLVSNCDGVSESVLTASSNSGLPVMYTSSNTDVVTISNDELVYNNSGSATITASQAGNNNYNAAETVSLPVINSQPNLIRQQFENVIFFDNSSKEFKSYAWYKDGILVADQTLQYYKETGGLNGTYYAVATKLDGTLITSCPLTLSSTKTVETVRIYPNPVRKNESYQLITNIDPAKMLNARIEVFAVNGSLIDQRTTNDNETTLQAPNVEAVYIVRMTLSNGKTFTKNLLVKN